MVRRGYVLGGALAAAVVLLTSGWSATAATTPSTVELTVAPTGSGSACSVAVPCSLQSVQARVRALSSSVDVDVVLTDGTYFLDQPLRFGADDGGRDGHRVEYRNADNAHPVLSGGRLVTGWAPDPVSGAWTAAVPSGTASRELYVNGRRAPRTTTGIQGWVQTDTGYLTPDTSVLGWHNPSNVELVFSQGNGFWTEPRCDVASVTPAPGGAAITLRQPCWSNLHIPATPSQPTALKDDNAMGGFQGLSRANPPSSVENIYGPLAPGQWYLDQPAGRLYYQPQAGEDPNQSSIVLPVLETLIDGTGTLDRPVHDLTFQGLTFAHTTWRQPSGDDGFAEMQANMTLTGLNASGSNPASGRPAQGTCQYTTPRGTCPFAAWTKPPAAVSFRAAHRVAVMRDTFTHLGAAGLAFAYGSQDNVIEGNEISDTSGSGIMLGDTSDPLPKWVGADDREINERNTIANNWIHDVAAEYHGGIGIWVGYTRDTLIAHNQIARTPYTAISMGWGGWHTDTLNPDNPNINARNTIADNLIYDYLTTLPDGGAIYTNGPQGPFDPAGPAIDPFLTLSSSPGQMAQGLTIRGNVALLATWSEFAYYNDEGSDYISYDHNVEYQAHALAHGGCSTVGHILIAHSYWAQPSAGYICPPPPVDVKVVDHHIIPDHPGPGDIPDDLLAGAGLEPAFHDLVTTQRPEVTGVGPGGPGYAAGPAHAPLLVSGSGFTPDTEVYFGAPGSATASPNVRVLSANYLIATPPMGARPGQVDIVVRTPSGTSATSARDQYVFTP
jgi:parallel beta-helix repeat protein